MDMSNEDKKKFLQFVTGSDRVPVGGLQTLGIKIQKDGECDRYVLRMHSDKIELLT